MRLRLPFIVESVKLHAVVVFFLEVILLGGGRLVTKLQEDKRRETDAWHQLLGGSRLVPKLHEYKRRATDA